MGKHRHGKKKKEVSRLIVSVTNMQTISPVKPLLKTFLERKSFKESCGEEAQNCVRR